MTPGKISCIEATSERVKNEGLIAILRGDYPLSRITEIAITLQTAGIRVLELTLNSRAALEAIHSLRADTALNGLLIGAGSVRNRALVDAALDAGAQFLVAPNFDAESTRRAIERQALILPGVFTASEAQAAFNADCRLLKLFPCDVVGPGYLKALRGPLDDIEFVPTGGISVDGLGAYVEAGAVAVGIGSALISGPEQTIEDLQSRAVAFRAAWDKLGL